MNARRGGWLRRSDLFAVDAQEAHRAFIGRHPGDRPFSIQGLRTHLGRTLLRYVEDPAATLVELSRVLKPGGALASLEFAVPGNPAWHATVRVHAAVLSPCRGTDWMPEPCRSCDRTNGFWRLSLPGVSAYRRPGGHRPRLSSLPRHIISSSWLYENLRKFARLPCSSASCNDCSPSALDARRSLCYLKTLQ